jgi:hypothetical protein
MSEEAESFVFHIPFLKEIVRDLKRENDKQLLAIVEKELSSCDFSCFEEAQKVRTICVL